MKPVLDRWSLSIPRWGQSLAAGLALLACPSSAFACTPVPPLFYALSGVPIIAGESIVSMLAALAVAVAIKSTAFCRLESRVPRRQAALWMVLANVLSTVPGLFICFTGSLWRVEEASVGAVLLGAVVVVRLMLLLKPKWYALLLGIGTMVLFVLVIAVAHSMFYQARRMEIYSNRDLQPYWGARLLCVTLLAITGIAVSSLLEEASIAWLARKRLGKVSFFHSVTRANYITLAVLLLVSAVKVVPSRLRDPQFFSARAWSRGGVGERSLPVPQRTDGSEAVASFR